MSTIAENIANIRARMNEAAKKAGRDPSEILLCAATKMNDADRVKEAVAAGVDCCGENRVQEFMDKYEKIDWDKGVSGQIIGRLQTNKVKYIIDKVSMIHSVDSYKLAAEIKQDAETHARVMRMRTYDYVDKMLYDMQGKMDELNMKYFGEMYTSLENTFVGINETLAANREEMKNVEVDV